MNKTRILALLVLLAFTTLYFIPENDFTDFIKGLLAGGTIAYFFTHRSKKMKNHA